ncbi:hypothetical protein LSUCC0031_06015 [Rhodobacterales bacterium LSUCC0031]|nr:hypothetical protein [Rhodobacterales bacterium LSUCC0031]
MGYKFLSEEARDESGFSVATLGDIDGDGLADFLIGAQRGDGIGNAETWSGSTYLIKGADLPALDLADGTSDGVINLGFVRSVGTSYEIVGEDQGDFTARSISSAGDVDGDGRDDILIGASGADGIGNAESSSGGAYLIMAADLAALDGADGATDGIIDLGQVAATGGSYEFVGKDQFDGAGEVVRSAGDVDGDGRADLLISAREDSPGANFYLIKASDLIALDQADGTADGIINLGTVAATGTSYKFVGDGGLLFRASSAGDIDNDGQADLLLGDPNWQDMRGAAYLINANDLAALDLADGTVDGVIRVANVAATGTSYQFVGRGDDDRAGWSVSSAGDVDGDGKDDLLIGAYLADGSGLLGFMSGVTYLVNANDLVALDAVDGSTDGIINLSSISTPVLQGTGASYRFIGDRDDHVGWSVSATGDVNGDGLADFLIGAPRADGIGNAASNVGSAYLISGADLVSLDTADGNVNGIIDLDNVAATGTSYEFIGPNNNDNAGFSVSAAGDVDGDGLDDLLIGAVQNGSLGSNQIDTTYLIEADRLAFYDGLDGAVDGIIHLANVSCFLTGTRIATPGGPVAVERLGPGDLVLTADGRAVPVRFNLRQNVSTRFGPPERLMPVRLRAGALGQGLPVRDLVLTADHALMIDGLLINAGALVNGSSIDRVPLKELGESFTVYHIETEAHDLILAEGTPAETFIDYAGRQTFDNYADYLALHGGDRMIPENPAPRVTSARMLPPALKARLGLERAA